MATKTYNPKRVVFTWNNLLITGFMDGSFIKASRDSDSFTKSVGSDGEAARTASADRSGSVTITLMQTAAANDLLSAALKADELTNLGTGPLFVKDMSGRTVVSAQEAWIRKPADGEFGKELGGREWVFDCADMDPLIGGN